MKYNFFTVGCFLRLSSVKTREVPKIIARIPPAIKSKLFDKCRTGITNAIRSKTIDTKPEIIVLFISV